MKNTPTHGINMRTLKMERIRRTPTKRRIWYYQYDGQQKQEIIKEGKWWYYNAPKAAGGGETGADTLNGAKGDLKYAGAKVWCELE